MNLPTVTLDTAKDFERGHKHRRTGTDAAFDERSLSTSFATSRRGSLRRFRRGAEA